jgi:hypothetical protein
VKQHKFERMDKGVKRSKYMPNNDRNDKGQYLPVVSTEQRGDIIKEALECLAQGETTDQIAARHNITGQALRLWLLSDERANEARKVYFDGELSEGREQIKTAADPLALARAREDFRAVAWLAERRLPQYYAQKQEVKHSGSVGPLINIQLSGAAQLPQDSTIHNVIEHDPTPGE